MTTTHSAAIARALADLQALALPAGATDLQVQQYRAQVERQSVLIGGLRALAAVQAAEAASPALDPATVLVHLKAAAPDATPAQLADQYRDILAGAALIAGQAAAPAPVAPPAVAPPQADPHAGLLPVPMPPMEAAAPEQLPAVFAPWYLETLRAEFVRHGWTATVAGAIEHWARFGRRQGRKWRPDAPAPAWGPREEDAPPGTKL